MEQNQAEQLICIYANRLPLMSLDSIKNQLTQMDYSHASLFMSQLKDPTISIILSILTGHLGIDRLYVGDIGLGILKLFTCGGLGVWWLIDIFIIMDRTKTVNLQTFLNHKQKGRKAPVAPKRERKGKPLYRDFSAFSFLK